MRPISEAGTVFVVDGTGRLIAHPGKNPIAGDGDLLPALPQVAAAIAAPGDGTLANAVSRRRQRRRWPPSSRWPARRLARCWQETPKSAALVALLHARLAVGAAVARSGC